jgi:group I intron endonuclease
MKRGRENKYLPPYEKRHDSAGIYVISMPDVSRLVYVGSAAQTIRHRWRQHICDLLANRHGNPLLQRAVNKYGIDKLRFDVLEFCQTEEIYEREQEWIARYEWDDLFNLNPKAGSRLGAKLSDDDRLKLAESHGGISSPAVLERIAEEYKAGAKQKDLAQKYNVDRSSIRNYLLRRGVELRPSSTKDPVIIKKVTSLYEQGQSAKQCAKAAGIDEATASLIISAHSQKRPRHEVARLKVARKNREDYARAAGAHRHTFTHPEHGTFCGYQYEFRQKFSLNETLVSQLCRGLKTELSGWKLVGPPRKAKLRTRGGTIRHFIHPRFGEFVGRQTELLEKYKGLSQAGLSAVVTGRCVSYKGWELKNPNGAHVFRGGSTNTRTGAPRKRKRKIPIEDYGRIRTELSAGVTQATIAERYSVDQSTISNLCRKQGWRSTKV